MKIIKRVNLSIWWNLLSWGIISHWMSFICVINLINVIIFNNMMNFINVIISLLWLIWSKWTFHLGDEIHKVIYFIFVIDLTKRLSFAMRNWFHQFDEFHQINQFQQCDEIIQSNEFQYGNEFELWWISSKS